MSQQPPRPWFRLASMVRPSLQPTTRPPPPPPPPVQQQTFRPPVALPTPAQPGAATTIPPRASAPPSPIRPTTAQPAAATTMPPRASAPPSPIRPTTAQPAAATTMPPRSSAPPSPIRPTTAQPAATIPPRTSAPASPMRPTITPAPVSSPVASPPPPRAAASPSPPTPQPTAPPSPAKTPTPSIPRTTAPPSPAKTPPSTQTLIETQLQKSPAKNGGISQPAYSITKSTTTSPAQSPPPPPPISSNSKPSSPITKTTSYPWQKSSPRTAAIPSFPAPSPKTKSFSAPPPSPLPTSTPFQTVPSSPDPTATPFVTRAMSPRIDKPWVETPPQSAKEKLLSHPPSPLSLPPAQIMEPIPAEIEQKTVLFQETDHDKSKTNSHKPSSSNGAIQRFHDGKREIKKDKGVNSHSQIKKYNSDSEESGFRVVTLAGENKGAIMELMSPSRKNKNYGSENGGNKLKNNSGDEGSSWRMKLDGKNKATAMETPPMDAFINCNVQGVNNSILYNCSCTHHDPGVHLSVSRKLKPGRHMTDN